MTDLTDDEIASTLLARVMREIQYFAASSNLHDIATAEEMWSRFLNHLNGRKNLERHHLSIDGG